MDSLELRVESSVTQQATPNISYRQIAAVRLLQLPNPELEATIARTLEENPAFEAETRSCCPRCNSPLESPLAPCSVCGAAPRVNDERRRDDSPDFDGPTYSGGFADDESDDPMSRVAATIPTGETLLQTLCLSIPADDAHIAEYLVGSLDHHGFLPAGIVADTSDALECDEARVEQALQALQRLDPAGIGARGAKECLLIQLERLRDAGDPHPLAETLVREHLKDVAYRRFREVAKRLGLTPKRIETEWEFIRHDLYPYPAHGFDSLSGALTASATPVRPDVVIRATSNGFVAEVVERNRYVLRVNPEYVWARKNLVKIQCDDDAKTHIRSHVEQAQTFIAALRQRWETMQRVSDALIEMQREFLEVGQSALKPLTRADVARKIGLHESTVSRATDGKFVLLPNGRTASFDDFFDASLPAKKALCDIITEENPQRPYSDEQLMRILHRQGIEIARRTIAKYREELQILPSRLRRTRSSQRQARQDHQKSQGAAAMATA
ncbi:MAG TPA: RNA polymerase factor sigma-54 [Ktedonobacterales bacterium]